MQFQIRQFEICSKLPILAINALLHFFCQVISTGKTTSARGCFSAVPCACRLIYNMSRFNSWVAEAMHGSKVSCPRKQLTVAESPDRASNLEPFFIKTSISTNKQISCGIYVILLACMLEIH